MHETHPALEAVDVEAERAGGDVLAEQRAAAVGRGAARREALGEAAHAHGLAVVHQEAETGARRLGSGGEAGAAECAAQVLRVPRALERHDAALRIEREYSCITVELNFIESNTLQLHNCNSINERR